MRRLHRHSSGVPRPLALRWWRMLSAPRGWLSEQERIGTNTEFLRYGDNTRGSWVRVPSFDAVHGVLAQANTPC
jgi:hypothetical protein